MKNALESNGFKAFLVDDQGLEVHYTSLKPSKERRFSDIILIQYSKSTQKMLYVGLANDCVICERNLSAIGVNV